MIFTLDNIDDAAQLLAERIRENHPVIAFHAPMGAGKTTLIRALCQQLGSADIATSPTFAIINEYTDGNGGPIYHFDLYRLTTANEVSETGFAEYLDSGYPCLIEWPEVANALLPETTLHATIAVRDDQTRELTLENEEAYLCHHDDTPVPPR